jgi:hypothetical protein
VVDKIRCEARAAVEKYGQGFENASIVYSFTFDIDEVNGAVAGFTLFNPFANGTFNLNANGGSNRIRHGNRNFELIDSFDDLRKMNCTRDREVNWIYPITGDVGMFDSVATFIRLQKADNPGGTRIFTFADTLTYTTTFTGGVASTLTLAPVPEQFKFTAANASLGASRTDVHTVVVTMAAGHQTVIDRAGRRMVRRSVPFFDARGLDQVSAATATPALRRPAAEIQAMAVRAAAMAAPESPARLTTFSRRESFNRNPARRTAHCTNRIASASLSYSGVPWMCVYSSDLRSCEPDMTAGNSLGYDVQPVLCGLNAVRLNKR